MNYDIIKGFRSKRNQVYLIEYTEGSVRKSAVLKRYNADNKSFLESEYENLKMLQDSGINVSKVVYKDSDSMILEYIQGELIVDLVESLDTGDWIDNLSLWLSKLHKISKENNSLLKMDVNLRNFIYSKGQIYGLDFEELSYGDYRTDLANICFFILTDKPAFKKEKRIIIRKFLECYEKHSNSELHEMDKFLLKAKAEAKFRRRINNMTCTDNNLTI